MSNTMRLLPPTNPLHLKPKKKKKILLPPPPVPPDPGATQGLEAGVKQELLGVALEMEAA